MGKFISGGLDTIPSREKQLPGLNILGQPMKVKSATLGGVGLEPIIPLEDKGKIIKEKITEKKALKGVESVAERIGQANIESLTAAKAIPSMLNRVRELSGQVPKEWWMATPLGIKERHTPLISPERQKLSTNMILLNQNILKMFQGSRPTDKDYEILKRAVDASDKGRDAFNAALDELEVMFSQKRNDLLDILETGYEVDRGKLEKMAISQNIPKTSTPLKGFAKTATNPATGEKMGQLQTGEWVKIK